ncbi:hypothetical protein KUTeg_016422 [Tegillarca granosa]|uniref:Apextrin C-terminal domain-containing protein n=1 Tax=Tegillarca granosa TaxID=220873 RepID=A0ABQ9EQK9_TEGGR|nr:hypothetical protein KUTeg_016422 [Tegillarca granosa]
MLYLELKCPDFKETCKNGGFVSYIRDKCICRCPDGLDPYTGCTKKYYGDTSLSFLWPMEGFSLLKVNAGCPPGFVDLSASTLFNTDPKLSSTQFCTKLPSLSEDGYSNEWQPGTYCIFQYDGHCPNGFISKGGRFKRQLEDLSELIADARQPDELRMLLGQKSNSEMLDNFLCCRKDGRVTDALRMPDNHPHGSI